METELDQQPDSELVTFSTTCLVIGSICYVAGGVQLILLISRDSFFSWGVLFASIFFAFGVLAMSASQLVLWYRPVCWWFVLLFLTLMLVTPLLGMCALGLFFDGLHGPGSGAPPPLWWLGMSVTLGPLTAAALWALWMLRWWWQRRGQYHVMIKHL